MPAVVIKPSPISKKAVIVLSFPLKANWDILNSLNNGCYLTADNETHGAHTTLALYSLVKALEYRLGGTGLDAARNKFATIVANTQRDMAIITVTTEPSFSAVRKVIGVIAKNFDPARTTPVYRKYAQLVGMRFEPGVFAHAVAEIVRGVDKLHVYITGSVRIPVGKENTYAEIVATIKPSRVEGATAKAPGAGSRIERKTWDEIKCTSALEAFYIQQLLHTMQIETHVRDGHVIPVTGTTAWDTIRKKIDKDRIRRYADRLLRLGDRLPDVMRLTCAVSGYFTATELTSLPTKYTADQIVAAIKKHI